MAFENTPPFKRARTGAPQSGSLPRGMTPPRPFSAQASAASIPQPPQQQLPPSLPLPWAPYPHVRPPPQQQQWPPPPLPFAQAPCPHAQPPMAAQAHPPALVLPQAMQGFSSQPHAQRLPSAAVGTGSSTTHHSTAAAATATGSLTVIVDSKKKKLILGQDQTMINWMRSQSGASIKMLSSNATETTFQIEGKPQCVQKAKLLMDTALIENQEYINRGHPGNPPKRMPGHACDGSKQPP